MDSIMPTTVYSTANNTPPGNGTVYTYTTASGLTPSSVVITNGSGISGSGGTQYTISGATVQTTTTTTPIGSLLGGTFVLVPGATATYDVASTILTPLNVYIGGTAAINLTSVAGATHIYADGGNVTLSTTLAALGNTTISISNGGVFSNGTSLATALSGSTVTFAANGGTFIANAGSTLINLSGTVAITNYNPNADVIQFTNLAGTVESYIISGTGANTTISLYSGVNGSGTVLASYTVTPSTAGAAALVDGIYAKGAGPLALFQNGTVTDVGTCFLAGSMIETPDGSVAVEDIHVGDSVVAYVDGVAEVRNVIWTGTKHVTVNPSLAADEAGYPVRIRENAIADGVPNKDLLVTAEHCLFVDGKFVPARMHVNGSSIAYDRSITSYDYYHVETADHAVIKANNVLTESYLDTGNRAEMRQEGNVVRLGGSPVKTWEKDGAAPLCVDRAIVEPLFQRLAARAEALGLESVEPAPELTTDPNLHLVTKTGRVLRKTRDANGFAMFMIPAGVEDVWVVSRASRPSDVVGPFLDDRRNLGVLVGDVVMFDSGTSKQVDSHLTTDLEGWNNREQGNVRWTSGRAYLALGRRRPDAIGMLGLKIMAAGPYLVETEVAAATVANSDV